MSITVAAILHSALLFVSGPRRPAYYEHCRGPIAGTATGAVEPNMGGDSAEFSVWVTVPVPDGPRRPRGRSTNRQRSADSAVLGVVFAVVGAVYLARTGGRSFPPSSPGTRRAWRTTTSSTASPRSPWLWCPGPGPGLLRAPAPAALSPKRGAPVHRVICLYGSGLDDVHVCMSSRWCLKWSPGSERLGEAEPVAAVPRHGIGCGSGGGQHAAVEEAGRPGGGGWRPSGHRRPRSRPSGPGARRVMAALAAHVSGPG
jgi:hypothetical protein